MWRRDPHPHPASPLQASASCTGCLINLWAPLFVPLCLKLTAMGLSFPATKEDELSLFHKVTKLSCAFVAEKL